jgi:formylglycine-generating enzyme required for sulfatase activity
MPPSTGTRRRNRPGVRADRAAVRAGAPPGDEGRVRRVPGGHRLEAAAGGALARGGSPAGVQRAPTGREAYLAWLREQTGQRYRLPTEAEWEFAARAGTRTAFAFGDSVGCRDVHFNSLFPYEERRERRRWYLPLCIPTPRPLDVGSFPPNLWGLHDMHGNVQEFTATPWRDSHADLPRNGVYRRTGDEEWLVVKGGSWFDPAVACRSAARRRRHITEMDTNLGFRVLREL